MAQTRVGSITELDGKVGIISDRFYALVYRQVRVQLYPLAGIAHTVGGSLQLTTPHRKWLNSK
jgi:hypothetical protein